MIEYFVGDYRIIDLLLLNLCKGAKCVSHSNSIRLTTSYVHIVSIPTYDDPQTLHSQNETSPLHICENMLEMAKWYLSRKPSNDLVMDCA